MFGKRIRLFNLLGFEVRLDLSWIIIAVLVTWSLSAGLFPFLYPNLPPEVYWGMGVAGALGLFGSIIFHEFCHSLVARKFGMPMKGITLFIFGGVAEMGEEPPNAKAEFLMAAAGPLSSFLISGVFYLIYQVGLNADWPHAGERGAAVPVLDQCLAGRRSISCRPFPWTAAASCARFCGARDKTCNGLPGSRPASAPASALCSFSWEYLEVLRGNAIGGIWWFLIGLFLRGAAQASYQQLMVRKALEGEHIRRFMNPHPVTVPPTLTVADLVEDYVLQVPL